ncbi:MAG: prephenate dehydrogenase [Acidimicrobiia bacterium]|nr:prephenate dehydrogenase [Acidimicrobiia bacterium]
MGPGRAFVIGTGLIGGSVGLSLRKQGWVVHGVDANESVAANALSIGALDAIGPPPDADLTIVATPASVVADNAIEALASTSGPVTDVGSVKGALTRAVDNPRFVGGHPMAGSEQEGLVGARDDLFVGATWVLTPDERTDDDAFALVRTVVSSFGAEVVTLDPDRHDHLVAMVSHVPHLTAATLMRLADARSEEHRAVLRLAAGGFRDMTRVASGHPGIWPDICAANAPAITQGLDELIEALTEMRQIVADNDDERLLGVLTSARAARVNLPTTAPIDVELSIVRVPVFDRPGELARITRMATDIDINIYDLEIAHSAEGRQGVLVLVVEARWSERLMGALMAHDYRPTARALDR